MDNSETLLREIAENTRVIAQILTLTSADEVWRRLEAEFDTPEKLRAYRLSDGVRSARQVAELAGVTHPSIGRWWREWAERGLVRQTDAGRMSAVIDLELLVTRGLLGDGGERGSSARRGE